MAALVDTNILVYRCDARFPQKRDLARTLLSHGLENHLVCLPHQALVEFVSVTTRPRPDLPQGRSLLPRAEALQQVEEMLDTFIVLYPTEDVVRAAVRAAELYQLNWFDAHLLAYAEVYGLADIYSEDFQHQRYFGQIRAVNPFLPLDYVNEAIPYRE
ncbi:MAG TPA: PIN domain-containing protein [Thermoanaerobaculia bacterium]|nr:PIN domain-containing protein [Thermoanaerobaculia bacterium]